MAKPNRRLGWAAMNRPRGIAQKTGKSADFLRLHSLAHIF
jgi:hypothetical protein